MKIYFKDIFGFAENQLKATLGLGYRLILAHNTDNAVLNKDNAINIDKNKISIIELYMPHYTPSLEQQILLSTQIVNKTPTELQYLEQNVFMTETKTQSLWTLELCTQEGIIVPIWIIVGCQQSDRQRDEILNSDIFYGPPVTSAQCIIGTEKYPNSAIFLKYDDDDDYSRGFGQIKEAFEALQKNDILQPSLSEHDFKSSNDGNNFGYILHVFDVRYRKTFESAQPTKLEKKIQKTFLQAYMVMLWC